MRSTKDELPMPQLERAGFRPTPAVAEEPGPRSSRSTQMQGNAGLACMSALYLESHCLLSETPWKPLSQGKRGQEKTWQPGRPAPARSFAEPHEMDG